MNFFVEVTATPNTGSGQGYQAFVKVPQEVVRARRESTNNDENDDREIAEDLAIELAKATWKPTPGLRQNYVFKSKIWESEPPSISGLIPTAEQHGMTIWID